MSSADRTSLDLHKQANLNLDQLPGDKLQLELIPVCLTVHVPGAYRLAAVGILSHVALQWGEFHTIRHLRYEVLGIELAQALLSGTTCTFGTAAHCNYTKHCAGC